MNGADGAAMQTARRGLSALFFSGLLTALLGAVLPVWRYHIEPDYIQIGNYFLLQNLGILGGALAGAKLIGRKGIGFVLALGCGLACAALLVLAAFCPPASVWGRLGGLLLAGFAAGIINQGGMHAITPAYELDRTATLNLSGILFGGGLPGLRPVRLRHVFRLHGAQPARCFWRRCPGWRLASTAARPPHRKCCCRSATGGKR